ncbi:hypothetical protein [Fibrella forsythiae]|uniref:Uncharacterized protein n=1 Tax=Fibrella forsythiae TaxID=2817061 RepID=A0ABS3JLN6_9BACT|nr:hypothetical protein [Fibrella forsythiae]MBO0950368.1 hypothetical protein [Fibrella forsythiae]
MYQKILTDLIVWFNETSSFPTVGLLDTYDSVRISFACNLTDEYKTIGRVVVFSGEYHKGVSGRSSIRRSRSLLLVFDVHTGKLVSPV